MIPDKELVKIIKPLFLMMGIASIIWAFIVAVLWLRYGLDDLSAFIQTTISLWIFRKAYISQGEGKIEEAIKKLNDKRNKK